MHVGLNFSWNARIFLFQGIPGHIFIHLVLIFDLLWCTEFRSVRRRPDITLMSKLDIAENCRNKFRKFPLTMDMNEETFSLIVLQSFPDNAWPWRPQPPSAKPLKNNPNNIQQSCMGESLSLSFPQYFRCIILSLTLSDRKLRLYLNWSFKRTFNALWLRFKYPHPKHWTMDLAKVLVLILLGVNLLLSGASKCERNLLSF